MPFVSPIKSVRLGREGFTLVELLIVITLVGVLSGVALAVIKPAHFRNRAEDSVRKSNLEKVAQGIEAYYVAEGGYPADRAPPAGVPDDISTYLIWPTDAIYTYVPVADPGQFCVYVPLASSVAGDVKYYKYYSGWHEIKECVGISACDVCIAP